MTPYTNAQPTAAIYARISMDRKGEELGVQRQVTVGRERADKAGIRIPADYVLTDNDVSAMRPGTYREAYERLLDLVRAGKVQVVIVYQASRLWRNKRERLEGMELFRRHGVSVWCVRGMDLDLSTAAGRFMADVEGAANAWESEVKAERMSDEHAQWARDGNPPRGPRCFGYTADGWDVVPHEAEAVADVYRLFLLGYTVLGLVRLLNERGLRTTRGVPFDARAVRRILTNERYCALRLLHGDEHRGNWPAIVKEVQWRAAKAIVKDPSRRTSTSQETKHLGSGLFICGACALAGKPTRLGPGKRNGRRVYRCRVAGHLTRVADPVDALVEARVVWRLSRPDAVDLLVDQDAPDLAELQTEAVALRARLDEIAAAFGDGVMSRAQFTTANQRARVALDAVTSKMQDAQRAPVLADLVNAEDVAGTWLDLPLDRKRALVDALMTVTVLNTGAGRGSHAFDPRTVRIDWRDDSDVSAGQTA